VYVCMCVCVCIEYVRVCKYVWTHKIVHIRMRFIIMFMYVCMCVCMYVCMTWDIYIYSLVTFKNTVSKA